MEKHDSSSPPPYESQVPVRPGGSWQRDLPPGMGPPSSSSVMKAIARPITYTIWMTSKAIRSFTSTDLPAQLVAAHRSFDAGVAASSIRVITHMLHNSHGNSLHVGSSGADEMSFRYIRIVAELPVQDEGGLPAERKQELIRKIVDAAQKYEAKKAQETEIDVVIREVKAEDEMWVRRELYT